MTRKYTKNRMQEKPNDFRLKMAPPPKKKQKKKKQTNKKHNEIAEWINNMTKELQGFEEDPKA